MVKILKMFWKFSNVVQIFRRVIGEIVRYLLDKNNISASSQTVTNAQMAPKICQS